MTNWATPHAALTKEAIMSSKDLGSVLAERKKALLEELNFVHKAISQAKSRPEASVEWIAKLEKWHDELHALIEGIPKEG
jgi:hypothetical protein